jgi:spore coat polysaccharide biosynthesis protein SpsF
MILAVVQCRDFGRQRGVSPAAQAMVPLLNQPVIWHQLERVRRAKTLTRIVVSLSSQPEDNMLAAYLIAKGTSVHRSNHTEALSDLEHCAAASGNPSHVVRLKADCPLVDPGLIDETVRLAVATQAELTSNCQTPSYPGGLEVEVFSAEALTKIGQVIASPLASAKDLLDRLRDRFSQSHFQARRNWSHFDWALKDQAALTFTRAVFEALHPVEPDFRLEDVLELMDFRFDLFAMSQTSRNQSAA